MSAFQKIQNGMGFKIPDHHCHGSNDKHTRFTAKNDLFNFIKFSLTNKNKYPTGFNLLATAKRDKTRRQML